MTKQELRDKVLELLDDESKWCQDAYAENKNGDIVGVLDSDAYRFCLSGAVVKVMGIDPFTYDRNPPPEAEELLADISRKTGYSEVIVWNDSIRYSEFVSTLKGLYNE